VTPLLVITHKTVDGYFYTEEFCVPIFRWNPYKYTLFHIGKRTAWDMLRYYEGEI
jgi:hypothetical protein